MSPLRTEALAGALARRSDPIARSFGQWRSRNPTARAAHHRASRSRARSRRVEGTRARTGASTEHARSGPELERAARRGRARPGASRLIATDPSTGLPCGRGALREPWLPRERQAGAIRNLGDRPRVGHGLARSSISPRPERLVLTPPDESARTTGLVLGVAGSVLFGAGVVLSVAAYSSSLSECGDGGDCDHTPAWLGPVGITTGVAGGIAMPIGWVLFGNNLRPRIERTPVDPVTLRGARQHRETQREDRAGERSRRSRRLVRVLIDGRGPSDSPQPRR